jgi:hypothetical protein
MMSVQLLAGIVVLVGGLLVIGFGFSFKEFSLGDTLILAGVVAVCTGLIMLSLSMVVRELRALARRLGPADQPVAARAMDETPVAFARPAEEPATERPLFLGEQLAPEAEDAEDSVSTATPWREEAVRDRGRQRRKMPPAAPAAEAESDSKSRRNLLFSSSPRKERERVGSRTPDPAEGDLESTMPAAPVSSPVAAPRAIFEDTWSPSEPTRPDPYRRSARTTASLNDAGAGAPPRRDQNPPPRTEDYPQVTVLKSGLVDGMAYSLYSDGSIEAELPEGMMRFASISELRAHLDHRP